MKKENKKQIDLLVSSYEGKTERSAEKETNVVAAFPEKGEAIIPEFMDALMKLSSCGYSEWEETRAMLAERKEEIRSFLSGENEEFVFEDKTYTFLTIPYEPDESDEDKEEDRYPFVYVKFDDSEYKPEIAYESLAKGKEIPSLCVPVIKEGSWPGLSLGISMPFTVKDKMLQMFDREGNPCGEPVKSALPLTGGFYLVNISRSDCFIVNREGIKVSERGVKVYEPSNGYCVFEKDGKYGFITEWDEICEPKFDEIDAIDLGAAVRVKLGDQWGYVRVDNEFVTEEEQDEEDYEIYRGADF